MNEALQRQIENAESLLAAAKRACEDGDWEEASHRLGPLNIAVGEWHNGVFDAWENEDVSDEMDHRASDDRARAAEIRRG